MFLKLSDLKVLFKKTKPIKEVQQEWEKQQSIIELLISSLSNEERNKVEWCTVRGQVCRSTGLLMWEKDLENRYTFANDRHCNDFYGISLADVRSIIGKTDSEIAIDYQKRTGITHTFGDMCQSTDEYTLSKGVSCRFWEMGYIGDKIYIFDVTKQPIRTVSNKVVGTRSWALNQSGKECEVNALLRLFLKTGEATPLSVTKGKKVAAYLITKKDDPFNGEFPGEMI